MCQYCIVHRKIYCSVNIQESSQAYKIIKSTFFTFLSSSSLQTWSAWCTAASGQKSKTLTGAAPVTPEWRPTPKGRPPSQKPPQTLAATATWYPPSRWKYAGRRGSYPWQTHRWSWRRTDTAEVGRSQSHRRAPNPVWRSWGSDTCRTV